MKIISTRKKVGDAEKMSSWWRNWKASLGCPWWIENEWNDTSVTGDDYEEDEDS